jgi:REP element-mobilizing transposase RayT
VQRGLANQPIFSQLEDYAAFERVLPGVLRRSGARVHAYCWTPTAIHLVLQIEEISVGRFMQALTGRYGRHLQRCTGKPVHYFRYPYQAAVIDANEWLLKLVQYVHYVPVFARLAGSCDGYPRSSHRAYAGDRNVAWLYMRTVMRLLGGVAANGNASHMLEAYRDLMSRTPTPADVAQLEGRRPSSLVIGSPEFVASIPRRAVPGSGSLDAIIQTVTSTLGVKREHVLSRSRNREPALARALIAWYASERGVATLTDVARRVRRDPSTLSMAISRYRVSRPELFKLNALHYVAAGNGDEYRDEAGEQALAEEIQGGGLRHPPPL